MSVAAGKRVLLAARPVGEPKESDFRIENMPVPTAGAGEMLLRTLWLSLDPYMRGRMSDAPSYATPVAIDHEVNAVSIRLKDRGSVIGCPIDINKDIQISSGGLTEPQQILNLVGDDRGLVIGAHANSERVITRPWNKRSEIGSRWKTAQTASYDKR